MATIFGLRRNADEDGRTAGGKIMRNRRTPAAATTPYARPEPSPPAPEEPVLETSGNPNWLTGLIYPARVIASGAGKLFSAVFGPDSYSSSSSSDGECNSEDEDDVSLGTDDKFNKVLSSMSTKRENVHLIQQLVMQETFSREECDELIKLVRSRVVKDGTLSNTETFPDACTTAVMEARKWLEEKKSVSRSKSKVTESEIGSPVDMAKSYMQSRPTWSSPSLKHVEFRTPSPTQNSKEEISKSNFHSPPEQSEMKRSAVSTGSWNIMDKVRRVRSKATEELLTTTPKKIDLASFSLEDKSEQDTMKNNMNDVNLGDKLHNLNSLAPNSDPNVSVDLSATKSGGLPEPVEMEYDRLQSGVLQTNNASLVPKQCQAVEDTSAANGTNPNVSSKQLDGFPHAYEVNGLKNSAANDRELSLSAADQTPEPCDKDIINAADSSKDKVYENIPKDNLERQYELSSYALNAHDNDCILSASEDSSSMQREDSLQETNQSNPKNIENDKPLGRRLRPRKGRGRGK